MPDAAHPVPLDALSSMVARAAELLDREDYDEASALAEDAVAGLTQACGSDWSDVEVSELSKRLGKPERARVLARALWIASAVDELEGRRDRARWRCRRAMELYARNRLGGEELDIRAARELGSASRRLGATGPRPA